MKMKNLFTTLLIVISLQSFGQGYHKLINDSLYWDVAYKDPSYICNDFSELGPWRYFFEGDTIINAMTYSKIRYFPFVNLNTPPAPNCPPFAVDTISYLWLSNFLREDTLLRKVFVYDSSCEEESVLFDFSLNQGDSVQCIDDFYAIVDTVYFVIMADGVSRKRIEFGGSFVDMCSGYMLEGIGGPGGPIYAPFYPYFGGPRFMCVESWNGPTIYEYPCYDFITGVESTEDFLPQLTISPNPSKDFVWIECTSGINEVWIFDIAGRQMDQQRLSGETYLLDVSKLAKGLYLLQIRDSENKMYQLKMFRE